MVKTNPYEQLKAKLQEYRSFKEQKSVLDAEMKDIMQEALAFANENPQLFIEDKLVFDNGTALRWADKSVVDQDKKKFSITLFFSKYRHMVSTTLSVSAVKKAMQDKETAKEFNKLGLSLRTERELKIEV
jgi:hypothetical protein